MEILKFQSHKWGHPSKSHSSQFINLFEIYMYIPILLNLQLASRLSDEIRLNFPLDLVESIPFVIQFFATHVTFVAEFCLQFIYSRLTWLPDDSFTQELLLIFSFSAMMVVALWFYQPQRSECRKYVHCRWIGGIVTKLVLQIVSILEQEAKSCCSL